MAPHSSTLAWRIPGTGEPHGLPSMGSHRVGHDWSDLAAAAAAAELVILSKHLILSCPLLLPSVFPSIRVFSNGSVLHIRWPKYWSFSFSISPSNEHSRLISFSMDWLDLLAVQGTQESFPTPQFKSINSSVLSFLYNPTLTSILDYWKNHSFDQMDLCWQSNVSAF